MDKKKRAALYTIAPVIIFILTYILFYKQTLMTKSSDTVAHMNHALSLDYVLGLSHWGWHMVCWLFYACLPIPINNAAALATASFNALTAILVIWLMECYMKDKMPGVVVPTIATVFALMVGPLYLRFYNSSYYMGQGTPNVWHNPTAVAVRPFIILISVFTVEYWSCEETERVQICGKCMKKTTAYQLLLTILLLASTIIKPSLLMVYLPVCGIVALVKLVKSRGRLFGKLILQHLYFVPSALVFLWQYISIFIFGNVGKSSAGETGIQIAFFKVAGMYAPSVLFSLILKMAFPFLVIFLWRKVIFKDKLFQITFWQFLAGLAITWTFAETGSRLNHGNFGWGNLLAASFLWIFCIMFYLKEWVKDREKISGSVRYKLKYGIPFVILLWHFLAGVSYYIYVLNNMSRQL